MIYSLIKKELQQNLYANKFIISFIVSSILILLTFYVGAKNYTIDRSRYEAAIQENIRSMSGVTDWRMINHKIYLPPQPLASLVNGISNDIGRNIKMEGLGELKAMDSKYNEDPIYAAFRFLDLNFVFQIILSLFAILLMYDAINGEKELGTLRLTFSNSVSRHQYIFAKIAGSLAAMVIPMLIPLLIGSLLLPLMNVPMSGIDWLKLLSIVVAGVIYFSVFLSMSIFISASTSQSSNSFLIMLIIWILCVIVIPKSSILIAGRLSDVPSVDEINSKKSNFARQASRETLNKLSNFRPDENGDMMRQFNEFMDKINTERDEGIKIFNGKLNEERRNAQIVQENLALSISRLSPASSFYLTASALAGTSMELEKSFSEQAANYQKVFGDFQREKEGMTTGGGMMFVMRKIGDEAKPVDPSELPEFKYQQMSYAEVLSYSIADFGILIFYNLLFFALAYLKFLKFDLR